MSIRIIRDALKAAGIAGAANATMRYGANGVQIYSVNGLDYERPAGESVGQSAAELARTIKGS